MAPASEQGRVVLHSRVAAQLDRLRELRHALAVLIEQLESLLYHRRDAVLARYSRDIGQLEYRLFCLEAAIAERRYRIAFLQREANLGRHATAERIAILEAEIAAEFEKTRKESQRREDELRQAMDDLAAPAMATDDARRLKSLYRQLCKTLHPDIAGTMSPAQKRTWELMQRAYRAGDLDLLQALAAGGGPDDTDPDDEREMPDDLAAETERLNTLIALQQDRIAKALAAPPLCYESQLLDKAWVAAKQRDLQHRISAAREKEAQLQAWHDSLLASSGPTH